MMLPNNNCYAFACGMERSGSSVYMRMIHFLIKAAGMGRKIGDCRMGPFPAMAEAVMSNGETWPHGIKLVRTHDIHQLFIDQFVKNNAVGFYVWRDIRDVMVSFTLRESHDLWLENENWVINTVQRITENYHRWTAFDRMLVVTYQELVEDKPGILLKTAHALGIQMNQSQANAAARQFEIDKMREKLPGDHINDGRAGMWRDHCTDTQAARLQEIVDHYGGIQVAG